MYTPNVYLEACIPGEKKELNIEVMSWKILRFQSPHLYSVEEEAENNKGFVEAKADGCCASGCDFINWYVNWSLIERNHIIFRIVVLQILAEHLHG